MLNSARPSRPDGWPRCPVCGQDELADLVNAFPRSAGPLYCYACQRVTYPSVVTGESAHGQAPHEAA